MIPDRRTYALSTDQPILREARRHKKGATRDSEAIEVEFWKNFNLEKFARGWDVAVKKRTPRAA
jgi:hypothetical protein